MGSGGMKQRKTKARLVGGAKREYPLSLPVQIYDQVSREANTRNMSMNLLINRFISQALVEHQSEGVG